MRDYLVFVRAGRNSLHRNAIANDPARNWDCCVSWYDGSPQADDPAEYHDHVGLNKFDAFAATYAERSAQWAYRYVLLLDDDLNFEPGGLSRFFKFCERGQLALSQPALVWGSHINHPVTLRNPVCKVRRVNFVEVMAPCFSRPTLDALLDTFSLTRSTWGIDYAWASILRDQHCMHIVDAVGMDHTKAVDPLNGAFYQLMQRLGADPEEEYAATVQRYPAWGPMRSLEHGHRYRWPLPRAVNARWCRHVEEHKAGWHYARWHIDRLPPKGRA